MLMQEGSQGAGALARTLFGDHEGGLGGTGATASSAHNEWLMAVMHYWVMGLSFVLVIAAMLYFVVKYRRRPGAVPQRSPGHNTAMELAWSIIPLIILVWVFFEGFKGYVSLNTAGANAIEMNLIAKKWNWTVNYPNGAISPVTTDMDDAYYFSRTDGLFEYSRKGNVGYKPVPIFVMPEDTPVLFRMRSEDVIHSFFVADFRFKVDVFPNRYTAYPFRATKLDPTRDPIHKPVTPEQAAAGRTGKFHELEYVYRDHFIFCAEYCGDDHSEMLAVLRIVPRDVYDQILSSWSAPADDAPDWQKGQYVARKRGCVACHSWDGSPLAGPSWKNTWMRDLAPADGEYTQADPNYIRRSILQPSAYVVPGYSPMTVQEVTDDEVDKIVAFIRYLSQGESGGGS